MTESEWLEIDEPDYLLEFLEGRVRREHLTQFVRKCWERITPYLPPVRGEVTVVEQYEALVGGMSDHDGVVYAAEAALKASQWAPEIAEERRRQAALLRQIVGNPFESGLGGQG